MRSLLTLVSLVFACGPAEPTQPPMLPLFTGGGSPVGGGVGQGGGSTGGAAGGGTATGGGTAGGTATGGGTAGGAATGGGAAAIVSSVVIDPGGVSLFDFSSPDLQRDLSGTLHVAYASGGRPRYGRCEANCTSASSWSWVTLSSEQADFNLELGVGSDGRAYMMWEDTLANGINDNIRFAQCSTGACTSRSDWQVMTLLTGVAASLDGDRELVVDRTGGVHLLASDGRRLYFHCTANCSSTSSWTSVVLPGGTCESSALAVGNSLVAAACTNSGTVTYLECRSNCGSTSSWTSTTVSTDAKRFVTVSLGFDSSSPRLAYRTASDRPTAWACDSACASASNWYGIIFGAPASVGSTDDVHQWVDWATGEAVLSFAQDDAVSVLQCTDGPLCWTVDGSWPSARVETEVQAASTVLTPPPSCSTGETAFSRLWLRTDPVAVQAPEGVYVLSKAADFAGCEPTVASYRLLRHRVHLSFIPTR